MSDNDTLSDYAAGEIRAMLGRRRTTGRDLAEKLGVSRSWVSYRLTGTTEITLNDLQRIAEALEVPITALLPQDEAANTGRRVNEPYGNPIKPVKPRHPVVVHRSPVSRPPSSRPVSDITPEQERPVRLSKPRSGYHA